MNHLGKLCRLCLIGGSILLAQLAMLVAAEDAKLDESLLTTKRGELCIVLSAPHGGRRNIRDCPERKGVGVDKFATVRDENTDLVAEQLADELAKKLGGRPSIVIARFDRKYLDVNRPASGAFESERARPVYEAYHHAVSEHVAAVRKEFGRGLLLDIHGQSASTASIYRGTNNGRTVTAIMKREGIDALHGPKSILGYLHNKGYGIFPEPGPEFGKELRYSGGHIVQTYGSDREKGIDAIQLEIGTDLRKKDQVPRTVSHLADAVATFAKAYLPLQKTKKE